MHCTCSSPRKISAAGELNRAICQINSTLRCSRLRQATLRIAKFCAVPSVPASARRPELHADEGAQHSFSHGDRRQSVPTCLRKVIGRRVRWRRVAALAVVSVVTACGRGTNHGAQGALGSAHHPATLATALCTAYAKPLIALSAGSPAGSCSGFTPAVRRQVAQRSHTTTCAEAVAQVTAIVGPSAWRTQIVGRLRGPASRRLESGRSSHHQRFSGPERNDSFLAGGELLAIADVPIFHVERRSRFLPAWEQGR